jgi:hypothetical protein
VVARALKDKRWGSSDGKFMSKPSTKLNDGKDYIQIAEA